jgi:hypothetical protein
LYITNTLKLLDSIPPKLLAKQSINPAQHQQTSFQEDGIVDAVAEPEDMLNVALELGAKWAPKAKMG